MEPHDAVAPGTSQRSVSQEQAAYWKAFVSDLFVGTLQRVAVSVGSCGLLFGGVAYLLWRFGLAPEGDMNVLHLVEVGLLLLCYIPLGLVYGLLYGLNITVLKKLDELERGIHRVVEPLMAAIIACLPGGQRGISTTAFRALLDAQIAAFARTSRSQFRILSVARGLSNVLIRTLLRLVRRTLVQDFLTSLHERQESQVSAKTVETFTREKLVNIVVARYKEQFEWLHYGLYGVGGLLLFGPLVLIL